MCQVQIVLVCAVIVACIQGGSTLQCWICTSQTDVTCKDYFNITRIKQNIVHHDNSRVHQDGTRVQTIIKEPHQENCEALDQPGPGRKYMCLKIIFKSTSNTAFPIYKRECRMVPETLKEGYCPEDLEKSGLLQSCSSCETDGCNSATDTALNSVLALFIPIMSLLYLRQ